MTADGHPLQAWLDDADTARRLDDLAGFVRDIAAIGARGRAAFDADATLRYASEALIIDIAHAADQLPEALRLAFGSVPWAPIRGQRNVLAHEYGAVDWNLVWRAPRHARVLPAGADPLRTVDLRRALRAVRRGLRSRPGRDRPVTRRGPRRVVVRPLGGGPGGGALRWHSRQAEPRPGAAPGPLGLAVVAGAGALIALALRTGIADTPRVIGATVLMAIVYLGIGATVGALVRSEINGSLMVLFVWMFDMFFGPAMSGTAGFTRAFPLHFPTLVVTDVASGHAGALGDLGISALWATGALAVGALALVATTRMPWGEFVRGR